MTAQPKLEAYLSDLDKALGQISISDRADIITEIKSHVLDAQEKNPNQSIEVILNSLGDPEIVAKKYLQERGLQAVKTNKGSASMMWLPASIKWLVIGFLGIISIMVLVVVLTIWRFSPLISVDKQTHNVSLMGGLIQVHDYNKNDVTPILPAPQSSNP